MYEELIQRLRETSMEFGEVDHVSVMLLEAANAIEELEYKYKKALGDLVKRAEPPKEVANGEITKEEANKQHNKAYAEEYCNAHPFL